MKKNITIVLIILLSLTYVNMSAQNVGDRINDLQLPDKNGTYKSLAALKGKYVLLHFWASWCPNSRPQVSNYIHLYDKYKNADFSGSNGFEIYSIAVDDDKYQWEAAMESYGMVWPNSVNDFKRFDSKIVQAFGVSTVPMVFMIDPNGYILAKGELNLGQIDKLLAEKSNIGWPQGYNESPSVSSPAVSYYNTIEPASSSTSYYPAYSYPASYSEISTVSITPDVSWTSSGTTTTQSSSRGRSYYRPVSDTYSGSSNLTTSTLRGTGQYKITVGTFYSINLDDFERLRVYGDLETQRQSDGTIRLLLGPYRNLDDAERTLFQLRHQGLLDATIAKYVE